MKLLHTEITPFINDVVSIELRDQRFLMSPFFTRPSYHAHPEMELVWIQEGFGKRIIGDKVEPFQAGDMVFIGPNVPHLWLSDQAFYKAGSALQSKAVVVYFNTRVFQQFFSSVKELDALNVMIRDAAKGISIQGETQKVIAEKLIELSRKSGYEKVEGLLRIMYLISISGDLRFVNPGDKKDVPGVNSDKLIDVMRYIQANLDGRIALRDVAKVACMAEQSFCRFFKNRTGKSFSRYLEDMRMAHARKLLLEEDKAVADIAYLCGYNSSSHFCKIFKDHTGQTPVQFKKVIAG